MQADIYPFFLVAPQRKILVKGVAHNIIKQSMLGRIDKFFLFAVVDVFSEAYWFFVNAPLPFYVGSTEYTTLDSLPQISLDFDNSTIARFFYGRTRSADFAHAW